MSTAYYVDGKRAASLTEVQAILRDGAAHVVFTVSDGLIGGAA